MLPDLLIDENTTPRLARILQIMEGKHGLAIEHMNKVYSAGVKDSDWIPQYANDGGRFVLTNDHRIASRTHEQEAIRQNGLYVFLTSKALQQKGFEQQIAFLLLWWPVLKLKMQEIIEENPRKGIFCQIPLKMRPKLEQLQEF